MVIINILIAFAIVGVLGAILGAMLAFAARVFAVKKNEKVAEVEAVLPGLNCGACGYPGCAGYAEAVAEEGEKITLCGPGGASTVSKLSEILGVEAADTGTRQVAQVHCRGGRDVSQYDFEYTGLKDCNALHLLYGGDKVCKSGCHGLGSCIKVCPVNAIDYDDEGKVWVDKDVCISCGKCIDICPTGVMKWVPYNADYIVACNNTDPVKVTKKICSVGCIACKICAKKSPDGGYVIENNLSTIDFSARGDRSAAAEKCPPKCIIEAGVPLQRNEATIESAKRFSRTTSRA